MHVRLLSVLLLIAAALAQDMTSSEDADLAIEPIEELLDLDTDEMTDGSIEETSAEQTPQEEPINEAMEQALLAQQQAHSRMQIAQAQNAQSADAIQKRVEAAAELVKTAREEAAQARVALTIKKKAREDHTVLETPYGSFQYPNQISAINETDLDGGEAIQATHGPEGTTLITPFGKFVYPFNFTYPPNGRDITFNLPPQSSQQAFITGQGFLPGQGAAIQQAALTEPDSLTDEGASTDGANNEKPLTQPTVQPPAPSETLVQRMLSGMRPLPNGLNTAQQGRFSWLNPYAAQNPAPSMVFPAPSQPGQLQGPLNMQQLLQQQSQFGQQPPWTLPQLQQAQNGGQDQTQLNLQQLQQLLQTQNGQGQAPQQLNLQQLLLQQQAPQFGQQNPQFGLLGSQFGQQGPLFGQGLFPPQGNPIFGGLAGLNAGGLAPLQTQQQAFQPGTNTPSAPE